MKKKKKNSMITAAGSFNPAFYALDNDQLD
jgi:hypothetical protein